MAMGDLKERHTYWLISSVRTLKTKNEVQGLAVKIVNAEL